MTKLVEVGDKVICSENLEVLRDTLRAKGMIQDENNIWHWMGCTFAIFQARDEQSRELVEMYACVPYEIKG